MNRLRKEYEPQTKEEAIYMIKALYYMNQNNDWGGHEKFEKENQEDIDYLKNKWGIKERIEQVSIFDL